MKNALQTCCLLVLLGLAGVARAAVLEYSIEGLKGELKDNAVAWLGQLPETPQERLNFTVSAEEKVRLSLQALGYYRPQIAIDIQRSEPVWQMAVAVEPGEPVRIRRVDVQVLGEAGEDEAFQALLEKLPFAPDDVLHHGVYDDFRRRLQSLGQQLGYFDGKIVRSRVEVEASGGHADIELIYDGGRRYHFGQLIYDEEQISSAQLAALRTFEEGDPFQLAALQELQVQLRRTLFYSSVIIQPQLELVEDYRVPVRLSLLPAKRHSFDVGIGYSTDTEERLSVTWRTPKLNRWGHRQETRLQYSAVNPSGRVTYTIPLTHPLDDFLQLWARLEDNEFGDLDSHQKELGTRRERRLDKWISGYSVRWLDESWTIAGEHPTNEYLLPGASLSRRDRWAGSIVDPSAGFSQLYQVEVAGKDFGSDVDLVRLTTHLRVVYTPWVDHRLVGRLELGAALISDEDRTSLAPSLNFFAGGSQSIRGYAYQSLGNEITVTGDDGQQRTLVVGGDRLVTSTLEYQYYLNKNWRAAVFVDAGDAFDDGEFEANVGAGFGIHFLTPVGAVRVEMANSVTEDNPSWRLHLNIGAEF